jgi:hypothetical protein
VFCGAFGIAGLAFLTVPPIHTGIPGFVAHHFPPAEVRKSPKRRACEQNRMTGLIPFRAEIKEPRWLAIVVGLSQSSPDPQHPAASSQVRRL